MTEKRYPLMYARAVADGVVHHLGHVCRRIEIAGSIRRQRDMVKDIEIVAVPKMMVVSKDLFGEATESEDMIERAMRRANVLEHHWLEFDVSSTGEIKDGNKYKRLIDTVTGIPIDLFLVTPPAQWGVIFMIRTGSGEWNKRFIARLKTLDLRMRDGRILDNNGVLDTPEEEDVFSVAKVKWKDPKGR